MAERLDKKREEELVAVRKTKLLDLSINLFKYVTSSREVLRFCVLIPQQLLNPYSDYDVDFLHLREFSANSCVRKQALTLIQTVIMKQQLTGKRATSHPGIV